jgi:hypothetical protein
MTAQYTVLIPPARVTEDEANFVNNYRRLNRITVSETLRRCMKALQGDGQDFKRAPYGSSKKQLPAFLVDAETAEFIKSMSYEKDTSKCQIIRSAIDCMIKQEVKEK